MTDFLPWSGGPCPVDPEIRVYVRYRDEIESKVRIAGELRWEHVDLNDDIVAYRMLEIA